MVVVLVSVISLGLVGALASRMRALAYSLVSLLSAFLPSLRRLARKLGTSVMMVQTTGGFSRWWVRLWSVFILYAKVLSFMAGLRIFLVGQSILGLNISSQRNPRMILSSLRWETKNH
jgi:hypothetical protein